MHKLVKQLPLLICIVLVQGCFSGPGSTGVLPGMVPAAHIRLKATILSIESVQTNKTEIPDQYKAEVKIDSIEGFGAGAKAVMSGDILKLHIQSLMIPPSEEEEQPGDTLYIVPKAGEQFRGDVETVKSENGDFTFRMSKYIIQRFRKP